MTVVLPPLLLKLNVMKKKKQKKMMMMTQDVCVHPSVRPSVQDTNTDRQRTSTAAAAHSLSYQVYSPFRQWPQACTPPHDTIRTDHRPAHP